MRHFSIAVALCLSMGAGPAPGASWSKVSTQPSQATGTMILLSDGTVMVQNADYQSWSHLTPDTGSYITGTWNKTTISSMSIPRQSFASVVLPSGKVLILGGKFSGVGLAQNWTSSGEVYDPVTNTWSAIALYPNAPNCPTVSEFGGSLTTGSALISNVGSGVSYQVGWTISAPGLAAGTAVTAVNGSVITASASATLTGSVKMNFAAHTTGQITTGSPVIIGVTTAGLQVGWTVSGVGIPAGSTIVSIDSSSQMHISAGATASGNSPLTFAVSFVPTSCFGDAPVKLVSGGQVLAGNLVSGATYLYDPVANSWSASATKTYIDASDGEACVKLGDGSLLSYDVFQSVSTSTGYAERDVFTPGSPGSWAWSSVTPGSGGTTGTLPLLSSIGFSRQLGPAIRLQDGRVLEVGANGHTAIYNPATNTWKQGPDITNPSALPSVFTAAGAPAAILPDGDVLMVADGVVPITITGNIVSNSVIVSGLATTSGLQVGWTITGTGIPAGTTITAFTSNAITLSAAATSTIVGATLAVSTGGLKYTQFFLFSAATDTITPLTAAINDSLLFSFNSGQTRMLVLPTGQVLFSDSSSQLWVFTPDGGPSAGVAPAISQIAPAAGGYLLTGTQLNGQSAGASQGGGVQMDENYPIVSLRNATGTVYYGRTSNWSSTGVGGGATAQTVSFALDSTVAVGSYAVTVSGAGLPSNPFTFTTGGQIISFGPLSNQTIGTAPFSVSATASSGLTVTFTSLTPAICTVSSSTVTLAALGTCTIQASQAGNGNYSAAPNVSQSFLVTEKCDVNRDGHTNATDSQAVISEALGVTSAAHDFTKDNRVSAADIQIVVNAALHLGCSAQ